MRAFLALTPDDAAHTALARELRALQRQPWSRDVRWVAEENLHLTMRFLGDVSEAQKAQLRQALAAQLSAAPLPATLHLRVHPPALFPSARRPRVVACGIEPTSALQQIAEIAERCAQAVGLPPETKPFHPHITLGRLRDGAAPPALRETAPPLTLVSDRLCLYLSTLTPQGAIYTLDWACAWSAL